MTTSGLHYTVSVPDPDSHHCEVGLRIPDAAALGDRIEVAMAAWCPGSYLVRDYARFVRDLRAEGPDGAALPVTKVTKQRWRIDRNGADEVVVRYRVYGHELTVRTCHIDDSHAFLHGPAIYLYVDALRDRPHEVALRPPEGRDWAVHIGLPKHGDGGHRAANLDELLDCPVHMGEVDVYELTAGGSPARLVVWGGFDADGVAGMDQLTADLATIVDTHTERFGGPPYDDYTFMLMLAPGAYGGLEHRSSSANLNTPYAMATKNDYLDLLELLSHEFFHVWNGKRIYPAGLTPFRYDAEQYTRCLWVMEGLTSYYDRHTLRTAGLMPVARYLEKLAADQLRLAYTPGRAEHSLEESSFDAWIKLYQATELNANSTVSYYLKGGLVSLAMDFEIRRRTEGTHSLEDVLRQLWSDYGAKALPYPEAVQPVFEKATGIGMGEFFDRFIRGRQDPDLTVELATAGLELRTTFDVPQIADGTELPWLGIAIKHGTRVTTVLDGSPAAAAGVSPGDELIAVNRRRVRTDSGLRKRLALRRPGDRVELALFREGRLHELEVELAASPPTRIEIAGIAAPSAAQKAFYAAWLGEEHPCSDAVIAGFTSSRYL